MRLDAALLSISFLFSLLLKMALVIPGGFDGLYGQDAYAYYDFALQLQRFAAEGSLPGSLAWPIAYPILLAGLFSLTGPSAATAQGLSILLGALLCPLIYLLARQMSLSRGSAFLAAMLMAISAQAVQSSLVLMSDIPALFWGLIAANALWRHRSSKTDRWFIIGSTALTAAILTRWLYLLLILWGGLALPKAHRPGWKNVFVALIAAGCIALPQVWHSQINTFRPVEFHWADHWSPANAFQREFDTAEGHFEYAQINALFYARPFYDSIYFSPLLTPFLIIGLITLLHRQNGAVLLILAGWIVLPYLSLVMFPAQNVRYSLIMLPGVFLLAGFGFECVLKFAAQARFQKIVWSAAAIVCLVGIAHMLFSARELVSGFIANQQRDKAVVFQAIDQIPEGANLYTFGLTLAFRHYSDFTVYEIYFETPESLAEKWQRGQAEYLMINRWNIENQWRGLSPQINMAWLEEQRGLARFSQIGNYTLYRIKG